METLGDVLRQGLDLPLLGPLGILVVEAREHMLLVQPLQLLALARHVGQQVRHLIRDVGPARREQVHLDYGVAVIMVVGGARGEQAAAVVVGVEEDGATSGAAEAVGRGEVCVAAIFIAVGRMMGVGLSVGEVAVTGKHYGSVWGYFHESCRLVVGGNKRQHVQIGPVSPHGGHRKRKTSASVWPLGSFVLLLLSVVAVLL